MSVTRQQYKEMTEKASPPSPSAYNYAKAFGIGGLICALGELITKFWNITMGLPIKDARSATSVTLIFVSAALTALGWFSPIARHAGADTLVPITGFANAVAAPAIEFRTEGQVFGTGARIFTIAGPVLVFGICSSVLFGLALWLLS